MNHIIQNIINNPGTGTVSNALEFGDSSFMFQFLAVIDFHKAPVQLCMRLGNYCVIVIDIAALRTQMRTTHYYISELRFY